LSKDADLTPMFRQWQAVKADLPDVLVFFRMGDFYEMFGEDAEIGARELELTLTSRECGKNRRMPMCGVPYHAVNRYLAVLVERGYRVAICDQVEDPKQAKGLVRREVTRIVSPGTLLEDDLLQGPAHNFLLTVAEAEGRYGIALVDISTGAFLATEPSAAPRPESDDGLFAATRSNLPPALAAVVDEIVRIQPAEVVLPATLADNSELVAAIRAVGVTALQTVQDEEMTFETPAERLCRFFGVESLRGYGIQDMPAAQAACALALDYLKANKLDTLPHLTGISTYSTDGFMVIDATTRRNLELVRTLREGAAKGTLLWLLDKTQTPMGSRLLRDWLLQPLLSVPEIHARLDAVENLVTDGLLAASLHEHLHAIYDVERLISRVAAGRANARDLRALCTSLERLPQIIADAQAATAPLLQQYRADIDPLADVTALLQGAITDDPPATLTDGGIIREGYCRELDELREIATHGRRWVAQLQDRERARTGIKSLKVGYNQVFGYYIEVSRANLDLVPDDYQRKQTLANAERFITPELKEQEARILGADDKSRELEYELFCQVRDQVAAEAPRVLKTARALAALDALLSLARAATEYNYVRPQVDDSDVIEIIDGRHPVIEQVQSAEAFVPNDTRMDCTDSQLLIVTGPNMAGKSTYLRQVALICLMAQVGSFVPARQARIGVVDRIFTRVGASDDLATGQSTFMVEMTETANILHNATDRSLIILDEIGRGTSTFDGLSLAWAVAEYIVQHIGARTLFATHYHHLNELAAIMPRVKNLRITVKEQGDEIIFLRKIVPGGTDRSYGIQVARLAGLPKAVIDRARDVLRRLEQEDLGSAVAPSGEAARHIAPPVQLQLFEAAPDPVVEELKSLDLDTLSPLEALMKLKQLKDELESRK